MIAQTNQNKEAVSLVEGTIEGALSPYQMRIQAKAIAAQEPAVIVDAISKAVQHAMREQRSELVIEDVLVLTSITDKRRQKSQLARIRQNLDVYIRAACQKLNHALISTRCVRKGEVFDLRYKIDAPSSFANAA
jgi:hypothetical protein